MNRYPRVLETELDILSQKIATAPIIEGLPALMRRISQKELPHGADIIIGLHTRILQLHYANELGQIRSRSPDLPVPVSRPPSRYVNPMSSPKRASQFASRWGIPEEELEIPPTQLNMQTRPVSVLSEGPFGAPAKVSNGISRNLSNQSASTGFDSESLLGKTKVVASPPHPQWEKPPPFSLAMGEVPAESVPPIPPAVKAKGSRRPRMF